MEPWSRQTLNNPASEPRPARGPVGRYSDAELVTQIRLVLAATAFLGEGYRKVWANLRHRYRASRARVLRLMREHDLWAPSRSGKPRGPRNHDGTIIPDAPDLRWGTDLTGTWTTQDGGVSVMLAIDHHTAEILGIHAAKRMRPKIRVWAAERRRHIVRGVGTPEDDDEIEGLIGVAEDGRSPRPMAPTCNCAACIGSDPAVVLPSAGLGPELFLDVETQAWDAGSGAESSEALNALGPAGREDGVGIGAVHCLDGRTDIDAPDAA